MPRQQQPNALRVRRRKSHSDSYGDPDAQYLLAACRSANGPPSPIYRLVVYDDSEQPVSDGVVGNVTAARDQEILFDLDDIVSIEEVAAAFHAPPMARSKGAQIPIYQATVAEKIRLFPNWSNTLAHWSIELPGWDLSRSGDTAGIAETVRCRTVLRGTGRVSE